VSTLAPAQKLLQHTNSNYQVRTDADCVIVSAALYCVVWCLLLACSGVVLDCRFPFLSFSSYPSFAAGKQQIRYKQLLPDVSTAVLTLSSWTCLHVNDCASCAPALVIAPALVTACRLPMIHQNSMRFYNDIAYDKEYNGLVLDKDEGQHVALTL